MESSDDADYVLDSAFWLNGQALGFPVQFDLVLKHLRQDMRDDWYFDCLQYDDLFKDSAEAKRVIISLLQEWNGVYRGTRSVVRNIPKKGYGERYGLETDFFDRFVYQAICSFLIPFELPPSERSIDYESLDQGRDDECLRKSTSPKRSSGSCVKLKSCWARAGRPPRRVGGSRSASRPTTAGARNMVA
jgi:hypothetical protein